jgi:hypothetical protein
MTSTESTTSNCLRVSSDEELNKIFQGLYKDFKKAEDGIKRVEKSLNDLPIEAVNQLRYAGNHLLKVVSTIDFEKPPVKVNFDGLLSARKHCLRAYYDAFDLASSLVGEHLHGVLSNFEKLKIPFKEQFPEVGAYKKELRELEELRNVSDKEYDELLKEELIDINRKDYYFSLLEKKLDVVFNMHHIIYDMVDYLNVRTIQIEDEENKSLARKEEQDRKDRLAKEEQDRKDKKLINITIILGIATVIAALSSVAFDSDLKKFGSFVKESIGISSAKAEDIKSTSLIPVK